MVSLLRECPFPASVSNVCHTHQFHYRQPRPSCNCVDFAISRPGCRCLPSGIQRTVLYSQRGACIKIDGGPYTQHGPSYPGVSNHGAIVGAILHRREVDPDISGPGKAISQPLVCSNTAYDGESSGREIAGRPQRFACELTDDRRLKTCHDVREMRCELLRCQGLHIVDTGSLEAAETELIPFAAERHSRKRVVHRIPGCADLLDHRPTRETESQILGKLVQRFSSRIVMRCPQNSVMEPSVDINQLRVPSGHNQRQHRKIVTRQWLQVASRITEE